MVDVAQKARGRQPLRYEFEVIPYFVGEQGGACTGGGGGGLRISLRLACMSATHSASKQANSVPHPPTHTHTPQLIMCELLLGVGVRSQSSITARGPRCPV